MTVGRAWAVLIGGIIGWEIIAPPGHLLTDGVRRGRDTHPLADVAIVGVIVGTAGHLLGIWGVADPFRLFTPIRRH